MKYRLDKYGNKLSVLGYGCMRFSRKAGMIDFEKAEREILTAVEGGINYFDTAYIYPGSEALLGKVLEKNGLRDRVYIATKLPHYLIKSRDRLDKLFEEELSRLRTDHIDYYFMHMLTNVAAWERMCALGIKEWIAEKKASGQIRQVGFSYHGGSDDFCALLEAYDWDFCMIQYNYMDEHTQAGRRGLQRAHEKGLPVMIMEPLRGGKLARVPSEAEKLMKETDKDCSPAGWSFRWLWNQKEVTVVLSGMNSEEMVRENITVAGRAEVGTLTEEEHRMLARVAAIINSKMKVGCTGCGYCMPCPKGVDIPAAFAAYNRAAAEGRFWAIVDYAKCTALRREPSSASQCIGCGKCETHCPQQIEICKELKNAEKTLEIGAYRALRWVNRKFKLF